MKLNVELCGEGPALVMVHGWGLNNGAWEPLVPALAQHFRLHLVELPGHGHSPSGAAAPHLAGWAEAVAAVAPPDAAWLGWSLGGQVALAAALAGQPIGRLVLVAATPRFVAGEQWPCAMPPETFAGFAAELASDHPRALRNFLVLQLRGDPQAARLLAALRAALASRPAPAAEGLRAGLDILSGTDLRDRLAAVAMPALVIAGARDRLVPSEAARRLAAALPGGRCLLLPDTAHAPFLQQPGQFATAVAEFLGATAAATP